MPDLPPDARATLAEAYAEAAADLDTLVGLAGRLHAEALHLGNGWDDEPHVATALTKGLLRHPDVWTPLMLCTVLGAAVARLAAADRRS